MKLANFLGSGVSLARLHLMSSRLLICDSGAKGTSCGGCVGRANILNGEARSSSSCSSPAAGATKQSTTVMQHHQLQPPLAPLPPSSQSHLEQFSVAHHPHAAAAAVAAMQASNQVYCKVIHIHVRRLAVDSFWLSPGLGPGGAPVISIPNHHCYSRAYQEQQWLSSPCQHLRRPRRLRQVLHRLHNLRRRRFRQERQQMGTRLRPLWALHL